METSEQQIHVPNRQHPITQQQYVQRQPQLYPHQMQGSLMNQKKIRKEETPHLRWQQYETPYLDYNQHPFPLLQDIQQQPDKSILHNTMLQSVQNPLMQMPPSFQSVHPSIYLTEQVNMQSAPQYGLCQMILPPSHKSSQLLEKQNSISDMQKQMLLGQKNNYLSMLQPVQTVNQNVSLFQQQQLGENTSMLHQQWNQESPYFLGSQVSISNNQQVREMPSKVPIPQFHNATGRYDQWLQSKKELQNVLPASASSITEAEGDQEEINPKEYHDLLEEIRETNQNLMYTNLSTEDYSADSVLAAGEPRVTVIKCSIRFHTPTILGISHPSAQMSKFWHLWLLIPPKYPNCSPIILDNISIRLCEEFKDSFLKALSILTTSVLGHPKPVSLKKMAGLWESSANQMAKEIAKEIAKQIKDKSGYIDR